MAQFTIEISAEDLNDLVSAYSEGWSDTLPDGNPNPQTQNDYAKAELTADMNKKLDRFRKSEQTPPAASGITVN